ncbi:MAG: hypothetical protein LBG69_00040 [Zoogloeaceae bacterium]|jgi:hypothetical protein|nr:hypothetical protein [Zoogloeaceae bacterium]
MDNRPYPDGFDVTWLASDREGNVAVLITAGWGPMPSEVLKGCYIPVDEIERMLYEEMPKLTQAHLLESIKTNSFIELAERGVFVYDWTDSHKTTYEQSYVYKKVAFPVLPIEVDALPHGLAVLAKNVKLSHVVFSTDMTVDIYGQTEFSIVSGREGGWG